MIGKTISHYKVLEKLGEGGMGVVYKGEDTKLNRSVALKFLPPHLTKDQAAIKRFVTEARAASALDHPNICTIYEINETDDKQMFISMAYYSGQILRDKIAGNRLPVAEAVNIAMQIAAGLAKAHEKNIVHRDIKPGNIILQQDGTVKIIDFGLSKLMGVTNLTKSGQTLGTLSYMSPEQVEDKPVDHRSDIWSLGVIMYEMLVGEQPFKGEYEVGMIYSILNTEPKPLTTLRADVQLELEEIVKKTLAKNADERYQQVEEFLVDLQSLKRDSGSSIASQSRVSGRQTKRNRSYLVYSLIVFIVLLLASATYFWIATSENTPETNELHKLKSIAVLPFDNISPNPNDEYLADGLTDEMISKLSKIRNFRVIARTSVMRYKETFKNVAEIGDELGVDVLLEGSVRKARDDLRISAQLVDVKTEMSLWSDEYNLQLDDIFDIQDRVSRSIVEALELKLSPQEKFQLLERPIDNIHAYESYIKARQAIASFDVAGMQRALRDIRNALEIVGDNELLFSTMGRLYVRLVVSGFQTNEDYYQKAEELADKVFDLNPNSFYGFALQGQIHIGQGNIQESVRALKRAMLIEPNNPDVLLNLTYNYLRSGKASAARPLIEKLLVIDPLTPMPYGMRGFLDCLEGRFDLGLEYYRKTYEMELESPIHRLFYAWCLAGNQRVEEACSITDLIVKDSPETVFAQMGTLLKQGLLKDTTKALQAVTPELTAAARNVEYLARVMAEFYALIDAKEEAINWLENAINQGFINYPYLAEHSPFLENIRGEERFKQLLEKVKYKWENFEI